MHLPIQLCVVIMHDISQCINERLIGYFESAEQKKMKKLVDNFRDVILSKLPPLLGEKLHESFPTERFWDVYLVTTFGLQRPVSLCSRSLVKELRRN